jgi:NADH:ubiquinone oxidoreductase subunit 6 (subunit J)
MIFWTCAAVTLLGALLAALLSDVRKAVLALWIGGLGAGGLFLSQGAELLAITQWVVSTLVSMSFLFYAVMFGEYGVTDSRALSKKLIELFAPLVVGVAFVVALLLGFKHVSDTVALVPPDKKLGQGVAQLGEVIIRDHLLSLEILALTLFLVIVGAGVVARPDPRLKEEGTGK